MCVCVCVCVCVQKEIDREKVMKVIDKLKCGKVGEIIKYEGEKVVEWMLKMSPCMETSSR